MYSSSPLAALEGFGDIMSDTHNDVVLQNPPAGTLELEGAPRTKLAALEVVASCHVDVGMPDQRRKDSATSPAPRLSVAASVEESSPCRDGTASAFPCLEHQYSATQHEALEDQAGSVQTEHPQENALPALPDEVEAAGAGNAVPPSPPPAIKVVIMEPERAEVAAALGLKTQHWLYKVIVDSTLPGLIANGAEVRRRFSEFEALNALLRAEFVGCFFPPLPQKAFLEANTEEFLRSRRQDLQVFLRAIVAHPALQHSEAIKIFLLQPGELARNPTWLILSSCVLDAKRPCLPVSQDHDGDDCATAPHHAASSSGSARFASIGSWVSRVKSSVAAFQEPQRELPAEEVNLRQAKQLLQDLERILELSTQSARNLCNTMDKLAGDLRDFGYEMARMAKYEEAVQAQVGSYSAEGCSAISRSGDCQLLAICQAKQSVAWKTLATRSAMNLVTMQDHHLMVPEAVQAMQERESALEQVHQLEEDLADKKQQLEQLQAPGSGKGLMRAFSVGHSSLSKHDKKSYQLSQSIAVLEDALKAAVARYNTIKSRNQSELTRLGLQREEDFKKMIAAVASNHAKLVSASASIWVSLSNRFSPGAADS